MPKYNENKEDEMKFDREEKDNDRTEKDDLTTIKGSMKHVR